jgi:hypothetical protein
MRNPNQINIKDPLEVKVGDPSFRMCIGFRATMLKVGEGRRSESYTHHVHFAQLKTLKAMIQLSQMIWNQHHHSWLQ